jgi:hypothetical protein
MMKAFCSCLLETLERFQKLSPNTRVVSTDIEAERPVENIAVDKSRTLGLHGTPSSAGFPCAMFPW